MGWEHRLSNVDESSRMADCKTCGPVRIASNGKNRWRCSSKNKKRKSRHHGLTGEQAESLKDGASCEICGSSESLKVDHDHGTGQIRGVLCHHCNVAIGHMRDNPERLRRAANYLEK